MAIHVLRAVALAYVPRCDKYPAKMRYRQPVVALAAVAEPRQRNDRVFDRVDNPRMVLELREL